MDKTWSEALEKFLQIFHKACIKQEMKKHIFKHKLFTFAQNYVN